MGILFSSLSFVGDRSDKFADLLASYPIKTHQYVFGKYLGLLLAMALSPFVGFTPVLISSVIISGKAYLQGILITLLSGILLSAMYAAWGALIGCLVQSRLNALAAALIMWFFSVFIYELLLWAFLPHLPFFMQKTSIAVLLSINPAQVVRIGAVFVQGDGVVFGADFYSWQLFFRSITGGIVGSLLIIAHLLFPIVLSILLTRNKK
jgi:Cu-processing system permease protein